MHIRTQFVLWLRIAVPVGPSPLGQQQIQLSKPFVPRKIRNNGQVRGKETLGRPRHRWEDNFKMDLQEVGYEGMDWIELAQDTDRWRALVSAIMNLRFL